MKYQTILDHHQQLRDWSCFQMAPELALKLAGLIQPHEYPYQSQPWDGRGYEPYHQTHKISGHELQFVTHQYTYPYEGMAEKFRDEIDTGNFPVVSLQPEPNHPWHGYVVFEPTYGGDFLVLTKKGSVESKNCESQVDKLSSKLLTGDKVDCLFWRKTN